MQVVHHFNVGKYSKEMRFAAGEAMGKHVHQHAHESVLAVGKARLFVDGLAHEINAPLIISIEAGKEHVLVAITEVVWFCVHETDETDPDKIDETLIAG